ncbi:Bacterial extracellular solute-binding protein [Roseovarius albus]|uniref:Bacterial extracellular solute-binding protein n=1 Tax=Roseovarius albus TaxID=1247867 RepID=A0A1X7A2B2_9RHOB|nr:extracellular solute-binding protein [Roseovarius albus]SLN68276.1 Bacterial extracellular solute-binding protein [Roseovarius albus]
MSLPNRSFRIGTVFTLVTLLTASWSSTVLAQDETSSEAAEQQKNEITFTSWTGPYMRSQMLGFVRPYEQENQVRVNVAHYNGGIDEIRDQVESANVIWDVVDLTQADSLRACEEGLLEDLSGIDLPSGEDGTPASDDFVEGALNDCGVGVIVWGTAFAYSNSAYPDAAPTSIADFFDTETYPGARAIRNDPTVIMEWALMADGVAREDVYPTLETPEGVEQALSKMDSIRSDLQLWQSGREPVRLLNSGEVAMSMIWATTGATASKEEGADFTVNMDGRVIELDLFGVPKGSRYKDEAIEFIQYASSTEALANMVGYLPNGPTRKSSLDLLSEDILEQIPNGPAYEDKLSIHSDAEWWAANHARLEEAFQAWLTEAARQGASGTVR